MKTIFVEVMFRFGSIILPKNQKERLPDARQPLLLGMTGWVLLDDFAGGAVAVADDVDAGAHFVELLAVD